MSSKIIPLLYTSISKFLFIVSSILKAPAPAFPAANAAKQRDASPIDIEAVNTARVMVKTEPPV